MLVLVLVFELYVFLVKFEELICNLVVVICFGLFFVWFGFIDIYEFVKMRFSLLGRSGSGRRVFFLVYCGIGRVVVFIKNSLDVFRGIFCFFF